jgi:environmental stress-induced protein Ves
MTSRSIARDRTSSTSLAWAEAVLRIIRAHQCRTTPWKNGGGSTTEIAAAPEGASLETFDWRISMARVACDGPFSSFPGIDRTLAVVKGHGMVLTIGSDAPVTLSSGTDPFSFAGDTLTPARLTDGEIIDLNVMTRRERFGHRLRRIPNSTACDFGDGDDIAIVVSLNGETAIVMEQDTATLGHGDAAIIGRTTMAGFRILPATNDCYLILLKQHRAK